jgi:hypothetical protein
MNTYNTTYAIDTMPTSIRLPEEIEQRLDLSIQTGRSKAFYLREIMNAAWMRWRVIIVSLAC